MHRVCLHKPTGRLLEMQSGGLVDRRGKGKDEPGEAYSDYLAQCAALEDYRLDTLRKNALRRGLAEDEIEVKWVDDAEWRQIQADDEARWRDPQKESAEAMIKAKMRELAVKALADEGKLTGDGKMVA